MKFVCEVAFAAQRTWNIYYLYPNFVLNIIRVICKCIYLLFISLITHNGPCGREWNSHGTNVSDLHWFSEKLLKNLLIFFRNRNCLLLSALEGLKKLLCAIFNVCFDIDYGLKFCCPSFISTVVVLVSIFHLFEWLTLSYWRLFYGCTCMHPLLPSTFYHLKNSIFREGFVLSKFARY